MRVAQDEDSECQIKGWLAISSLVRNCGEAQESFMEANGFTVLTVAAQSNSLKLKKWN